MKKKLKNVKSRRTHTQRMSILQNLVPVILWIRNTFDTDHHDTSRCFTTQNPPKMISLNFEILRKKLVSIHRFTFVPKFLSNSSCLLFARRAYCVGEALENHVCPSVRVRCPCPCPLSVSVSVSGPFSIRFQSSKMKIPVQFLRKRGPKRVPSATFGSKSEMDLGQRIIQIL